MNRLNVGCGKMVLEGWRNVDQTPGPGVDQAYLDDPKHVMLPYENDYFDEILMAHVLEHIVHPLPLLEELWRVAKPNAELLIKVPHGASDDAWEDPTHVRPYFPKSFLHFAQPTYWRADYGYRGDWQPEFIELTTRLWVDEVQVRQKRNSVLEMSCLLRAIKPARKATDASAIVMPPVNIKWTDA